jgi:fatty acid-binding protein DegV
MANGTGNGWRIWATGILGSLIVVAVIGGVRNAIGQGQLETQVRANQQAAEREMGHITEDLKEIKDENSAEHKAMRNRMESNKREILEAIDRISN